MDKILKVVVCAVIIQAGFIYTALAANSAALEVRGIAVNSAMTDRLSETVAELSAAQETGDSAKVEERLSRLFSGASRSESVAPVYADKGLAAPSVRNVSKSAIADLPGPAPVVPEVTPPVSAEVKGAPEADAAAQAAIDAANLAAWKKKKAEEDAKADAQTAKDRKLGAICMGLGLLLILLFI